MNRSGSVLGLLLSAVTLVSCGVAPSSSDPNVEYRQAAPGTGLEIPPDLSTPVFTEAFVVPGSSGAKIVANMLLPNPDSVSFRREAATQWLEFSVAPEAIWKELRAFIEVEGFLIARLEPLIGLIETEWAENLIAVQESGIRRLLQLVDPGLYGVRTRDKYRFRIERVGSGEATRLFVTHSGIREGFSEERRGDRISDEQIGGDWEARPRDRDLEAVLMKRFLVYVGISEQRASGILDETDSQRLLAQAYLERDDQGVLSLVLRDTLPQAWKKVGEVIEDIGVSVDEDQEELSRYLITYMGPAAEEDPSREEQGLLARIFSGGDVEVQYQLMLRDEGPTTRLLLADMTGHQPNGPLESRVLRALHDRLR